MRRSFVVIGAAMATGITFSPAGALAVPHGQARTPVARSGGTAAETIAVQVPAATVFGPYTGTIDHSVL